MVEGYVLIADSDREFAESVQLLLKNEGYATTIVSDGRKAIEQCEEELPVLVLLDFVLPRMTGIEVAKKIREMPNGGLVSILMATVLSSQKVLTEAKEAKIDDVLIKPVSFHQLISRIRKFQLGLRVKPESPPAPQVTAFKNDGYLTDVPFIEIVVKLYTQKATGTLRLQNATSKKLVTFEEGEPKFVVSSLEKECLGRLLVRKGRLTEAQCEKSLEVMSASKKRQGETLIEMGVIQPYELEEELKWQAREKFCEIFAWTQGQYLFVPGKVFKKELTSVDLGVEQLCLRGIKEHSNISYLKDVLSSFLDFPPRLTSVETFKLENFRFATWDAKIMQCIRRGESIADILKSQVARDFDVYQLFYTLFRLNVIDFQMKETSFSRPKSTKQKENPFEILGISMSATDDEIKKHYERKCKEAQAGGNTDYELLVLQAAYKQIATHQGRRDFLMRIYEEQGALPPEVVEAFHCEEFVEVGKRLIEKKSYAKAIKVFLGAIRTFPEEGILFTHMGVAAYFEVMESGKDNEEDREKAIKAMKKGVHLSKANAETHYWLGHVLALDKKYEMASVELQKAVNLNPKHPLAAPELRLAQLRLEKEKSNTSFIKWKR